jgi:acetylornithine deacetylase/succinyl-diaminopimelate desuccinylase-like protein
MTSERDRVSANIDREELADLALKLGGIDSPPGGELEVGQAVAEWLRREGFDTRVISFLPHRPNVLGELRGAGGGYSLIFNSHMDIGATDPTVLRDPTDRRLRGAWREGDTLWGNGVVNDKGPLACFLIAAKAIKKAGVSLKGDLLVSAVSGEIEWEPIDEYAAPQYVSHEVGTQFLIKHGGVADFALVAEATDLRLGWVMAGRATLKTTVFGGKRHYAPYVQRPVSIVEHPNANVRVARAIEEIEQWAETYEHKYRYECPGGTVIPKVHIGAVRGGSPFSTHVTTQICQVYVDLRLAPDQDVLATRDELAELLRKAGLDVKVEVVMARRGYEAKNVDPLVKAVERAHTEAKGAIPARPHAPESSQWRDINAFNEAGIPAAQYGPGAGMGGGNYKLELDDAVTAAKVYASVALDLCNQVKPTKRP